jgi:DNA polymerase-4
MTAKIVGGMFKPACGAVVLPGRDAEFLAPLPIEKIPGVGAKTLPRLHEIGIFTVADALARPRLAAKIFGSEEDWVHRLQGRGSARVSEDDSRKGMSCETTFPRATENIDQIKAVYWDLVEEIGMDLRREGIFARTIGVKVRRPDLRIETRQVTLPNATNEDQVIFQASWPLIEKLVLEGGKARLIGVRAAQLSDVLQDQLALFEENAAIVNRESFEKLNEAKDKIRAKFGKEAIHVATRKLQRPPGYDD